MNTLLPALALLLATMTTDTPQSNRPDICVPSLIGSYYGDPQNEVFKLRLAACPDINYRDEYGNTALLHAVSRGSLQTVQAILDAGADPTVGNNGVTPLKMACKITNGPVIRALLSAMTNHKIDPDILSYCTLDGPTTAQLIKEGAKVNSRDSEGNTPLLLAVRLNNLEVAQALLAAGAKSNKKNKMGESPLFWAAYNNNLPMAKMLLEHGARVNSPSKHQVTIQGTNTHVTPLLLALQGAHLEMADLLIKAGAKLPPAPQKNKK